MTQYIQIDKDKYIETDGYKATVLSVSDIQEEIDIANEQIEKLSKNITDEELLRWAKENYSDPEQRNSEILQNVIDKNSAKLEEISSKSVDTTKLFIKE